jgi:hypothetical protein
VGSTTDYIKRRSQHKRDSHKEEKANMKLYKIINDHGGWDNWTIDIIESITCETTLDSRIRERYWVEKLDASLNSKRPMCTTEEEKEYKAEWGKKFRNYNQEAIKEYRKQYNFDNKAEINEKSKQYYKDNKAEIKEYMKKYRADNKEAKASHDKEYNEKNKEKIASYKSEKIHCEVCDYYHNKSSKSKHNKTQRHLNNINKIKD